MRSKPPSARCAPVRDQRRKFEEMGSGALRLGNAHDKDPKVGKGSRGGDEGQVIGVC